MYKKQKVPAHRSRLGGALVSLTRKLANVLLLAGSALLAACGGGGGGGGGGGSPGDAFSLSTSSVTFNATQGGPTPANQVVNVTANSGTVAISTSQTGSNFSQSFTTTGATTGQITVTPGTAFSAGTFVGTITVNGCSNSVGPCNHVAGSPKTISVTYNVVGLSSTPNQLAFSATTGSNPPAKTISLAVSGGSTAWNSSISYSPVVTNWLLLSPTSGSLNSSTPSQTVTFNVNTAGLVPAVYNATATFTGSPGLTTSVTVTLTVNAPSVDFVAPYVVPAGLAGNVIIRGHGFSALTPGTLSVQFNTTPAAPATIVSDTEIHAPYPTLTAGNYAVSVSDGTTPIASRGALKLVVINPPAFPAASIARPASGFAPSNLTYDAERQALIFIDRQNNRIERYAFAGTWSASPAAPVTIGTGGGNPSIALSPDGTELLKTATSDALYRLDPATLAQLGTVDGTASLGSGSLNFIAFGNDGGAIGNASVSSGISLYRYDMLTRTFTAVSQQFQMLNRSIFASADGDTLVLPSLDSTTPKTFTYDASDGTLTQRSVSTCGFDSPSVNRNASRFILVSSSTCGIPGSTVYDGSFIALGTLPDGNSARVLSPDGNFAYAFYPGASLVRKFNLNLPGFTEVGSTPVAASSGGSLSEMTISPDGGTLFLAGDKDVIILPAP